MMQGSLHLGDQVFEYQNVDHDVGLAFGWSNTSESVHEPPCRRPSASIAGVA